MILIYYPDTDTLDADFRASERPYMQGYDTHKAATEAARERTKGSAEQSRKVETETYDADSSGQTLVHYREGRLDGLTIEHASRRAPAAWNIESLRREAANVAATTGRIVESVTYDLVRDRTSFQTGEQGPQSPYTSDEAVQTFNKMIAESETASAPA